MFFKVHHAPRGGDVVAVCDAELLNTIIKHGDVEVRITESFYGNRHATRTEVMTALSNADNINLMGERAVALAVEMGIISRSACILIGIVPHAQIFRI